MSDETEKLIIAFIPLIIAVVLHEMAHALMAEKLGDSTARKLGRVTFNPIKHIDPFMTIILPALLIFSGSPIIFGGAKPVPVNPNNFKHPRQGMAIVAAAGPAMNFLLALLGYLFALFCGEMGFYENSEMLQKYYFFHFLMQWILINVVLGVFNLFPIPPLDGGRIITGILPKNLAIQYAKLERFGLLIIFLLLYFNLIEWFLNPIVKLIIKLLSSIH